MTLDQGHKGYLQKQDLVVGLGHIYGKTSRNKIDHMVDKIFRKIDVDGSGMIEYSEWVLSTIDRSKLLSYNYLKKAFDFFDLDAKQRISLEHILQELFPEQDVSDKEIGRMLNS